MDVRNRCSPCKKRQGKQKSDNDSVYLLASTFSNASQNNAKFINSKSALKIKKLPDKFSGKTAEQVAQALLMNPTSPEVVTAITLFHTSVIKFHSRCEGEFVQKNLEKEHAQTHFAKLENKIGSTNAEVLKLHNQNAILQAQLMKNTKNTHYLKGQKKQMLMNLDEIKNYVIVCKTMLVLFNLLDKTKNPVLPFQNLPLEEILTQLGAKTWEKIFTISFNANHRAILVCSMLGLR